MGLKGRFYMWRPWGCCSALQWSAPCSRSGAGHPAVASWVGMARSPSDAFPSDGGALCTAPITSHHLPGAQC